MTLILLAQTAIPDSLLGWLTGSAVTVLAFIVWAFITGKIHSDKELQRVVSRCDEEFKRVAGKLDAAEAELRANNKEAREVLVPTVTKALVLLGRFVDRQSDNTPPPKGRG
jgi:Skp family chaperone for outer membrane proteins